MDSSRLVARPRFKKFIDAARSGDLGLTKKLAATLKGCCRGNFDIVTDNEGHTALHFAAAAGKTHVCKYLVKQLKLDIDAENVRGETPLHLAIGEKRLQTAMYLVNDGADVTKADGSGSTPLHYAVHDAFPGLKDLIKFLISRGADIEACSDIGAPLALATFYNNRDAVEVLLLNNANPNTVVPTAPLLMSCSKSYEISDLLVKAGADPNINVAGLTPLQGAVAYSAIGKVEVELITYLLKAGADPSAVDATGLTAMENAINLRHPEAVKILFPVSQPIPSIPDWSIDGLIKYIGSDKSQKKRDDIRKKVLCLAKSNGEAAFKRKDYVLAASWYGEAIKIDQFDARLFSSRSLCFSLLDLGSAALSDAQACVAMQPDWPLGHYHEGVAWKLLQDYPKALRSFSRALELDPGNEEIQEAVREAVAAEMAAMQV